MYSLKSRVFIIRHRASPTSNWRQPPSKTGRFDLSNPQLVTIDHRLVQYVIEVNLESCRPGKFTRHILGDVLARAAGP